MTDPTDNDPTYAYVVSCESVRILFLVAALYDIEVLVVDISNAFLNAQRAEKYCFKSGLKFNSRKGRWVIIVHALYGLKNSGVSFRTHLANTLRKMVFKQTFAYRDVWMRKHFLPLPQELNDSAGSGTGYNTTVLQLSPNPNNSDPTYSMPYYDYICTWVDYLLTVLHNATSIMREIGSMYKLNTIDGSK